VKLDGVRSLQFRSLIHGFSQTVTFGGRLLAFRLDVDSGDKLVFPIIRRNANRAGRTPGWV
jgi:hypothetical protein